MNRAFRAIRRSDIVALVIEALACITEQVPNQCFYLLDENRLFFLLVIRHYCIKWP